MKASKFRITGLCAWNSPGTGEFPAQMASNAENVSIWWHHHVPSAVRSGIFAVAMRAKLVCVVGIILCRYLCYAEIRNLLFVRLQWNDIDCMQAYILNVGFVRTNATNYICEIKIKEDLPTYTFLQWLILFSIFVAFSLQWCQSVESGDELISPQMALLNTVQCCYNAISFLLNPHNGHPITHPWGSWPSNAARLCCDSIIWFTFCPPLSQCCV